MPSQKTTKKPAPADLLAAAVALIQAATAPKAKPRKKKEKKPAAKVKPAVKKATK